MSNQHLRHLRQDVTHWATSPARFGGFEFETPEVIKGRWEEKSELFRTPAGEEVVSRAIVYLSADVEEGDYIALGDLDNVSDPTSVAGTYRVRAFSKISDLRNVKIIRKAWL